MSDWSGFDHQPDNAELDEAKYLLFRLGDELYGTPLLGVREVVEPQPAKFIPNTVSYFKGVINIRGQIVGLIDMRLRFGCETPQSASQALLVFDTETGPIAATVDTVDAVVRIENKNLERSPNIRSQVPAEFLIGIAQYQGRLVTLIDLNKTVSEDDYVEIRRGKMIAA